MEQNQQNQEEILYLEADEEITSIVDRLKATTATNIALVIPKRATLLQSIVNLKLLKKQGEDLRKEISLVTTDRMGRNLAAQVGLTVYQRIEQRNIPIKKKPQIKRPAYLGHIGYKQTTRRPLTVFERDKKRIPFVDLSLRQKKANGSINIPITKKTPSESFATKKMVADVSPEKVATMKTVVPKVPSVLGYKIRAAKNFAGKLNLKIIGIFILFGLFILAFVAFLILPSATVKANLNTEEIKYNLDLIISSKATEVNFEKNIVPGQIVDNTQEIEENFEATGKKDAGTKASGIMTIINKTGDIQPLVKTTQFKDNKTGKIFRTEKDVIVPKATVNSEGETIPGQTSVRVIADKPGEEYNVAASQFTIIKLEASKRNLVYGISEDKMTGGTSNIVAVVSKNDIKKAKSTTYRKILEVAKTELQKQTPENLTLDEKLIKGNVIEAKPSVAQDQQATKFSYFLKIKFITLAYDSNQIRQLAQEKIENLTAKDKKVIPESIEITYTKTKLNPKKETITTLVKINAKTIGRIDEAKLKTELKGRNEQETESYLKNLAEFRDASVSFWPFWVKSIPSNASRVKLEFSY